MIGLAPLAAQAQTLRSVTIKIEVDGKPLLTTITGDNGTQPPEVVWRYLARYPLVPVRGASVEADPNNPLRLTLKGKVVVDVPYGGKAEVPELRLQRKAAKEGWRIDEQDVEAMAKSIGLPAAPTPAPASTPSTPKDEMKIGSQPTPAPPPAAAPTFGGSIWTWLGGGFVVLVLIAAVYRAMPREHRFDRQ